MYNTMMSNGEHNPNFRNPWFDPNVNGGTPIYDETARAFSHGHATSIDEVRHTKEGLGAGSATQSECGGVIDRNKVNLDETPSSETTSIVPGDMSEVDRILWEIELATMKRASDDVAKPPTPFDVANMPIVKPGVNTVGSADLFEKPQAVDDAQRWEPPMDQKNTSRIPSHAELRDWLNFLHAHDLLELVAMSDYNASTIVQPSTPGGGSLEKYGIFYYPNEKNDPDDKPSV